MGTRTQKQIETTAKAGAAARAAGALFKPGVSPNPGGKPVGSRNQLQGDFLRELSADFAAHGKTAIVQMRTDRPGDYVRVVASLMPKEIDVGNRFAALNDDELAAGIAVLQSLIAAQGNGAGAGLTIEAESVIEVPALQ